MVGSAGRDSSGQARVSGSNSPPLDRHHDDQPLGFIIHARISCEIESRSRRLRCCSVSVAVMLRRSYPARHVHRIRSEHTISMLNAMHDEYIEESKLAKEEGFAMPPLSAQGRSVHRCDGRRGHPSRMLGEDVEEHPFTCWCASLCRLPAPSAIACTSYSLLVTRNSSNTASNPWPSGAAAMMPTWHFAFGGKYPSRTV